MSFQRTCKKTKIPACILVVGVAGSLEFKKANTTPIKSRSPVNKIVPSEHPLFPGTRSCFSCEQLVNFVILATVVTIQDTEFKKSPSSCSPQALLYFSHLCRSMWQDLCTRKSSFIQPMWQGCWCFSEGVISNDVQKKRKYQHASTPPWCETPACPI